MVSAPCLFFERNQFGKGYGKLFQHLTENRKKAATVFFWIGLFCELLVSPSGFAFGGYHEPVIIVAGMACFCVSILCSVLSREEIKHDWWIFGLLGAYGFLCYHFQHSALVLRLVLILLAGREQDRKKVVQLFFGGTAVIVGLTFVLAALGLHNSLVTEGFYRHGFENRISMGFFHPNGFSFFWMRLFVMGLYLYADRMKGWMFAVLAAVTGVPFVLVESKMGMAAFAVIFAAALYFRFWRTEKAEKIAYVAGNVMMVAELLLIYTLGIFPYPEHTVGAENNYWDIMNTVTTGRLVHAREAFQSTPMRFFGYREVEQATEIGFVNTFFHEGLIFVILYVVVLFWLYRRLYREHDRMGMLLVLAFTFYSMAEAYLPYFNKNGVWLLLIAGLPQRMMPAKGQKNGEFTSVNDKKTMA